MGDVPWLATAYVPGPSLAEAVAAHGPLPFDSVLLLLLVAGVAEALQASHACGIVHRDLKPSTLLLAADGPASSTSASRTPRGRDRSPGQHGRTRQPGAGGEPGQTCPPGPEASSAAPESLDTRKSGTPAPPLSVPPSARHAVPDGERGAP